MSKNKHYILFRKGLDEEEEFEACEKHCNTILYRSQMPENSIVWGRYSVLPFYKELEKELNLKGSRLINSYAQHVYVADIENWYPDFKDITPQTWFTWGHLPEGKYVVKGRTNSRKHEWNKRMFADSKEKLIKVVGSLLDDCLISEQGLCVREYIPLKTFDIGINEMPITNEWRFFFYKDKILSYGYYWSFYEDPPEDIPSEGLKLAKKAAEIARKNIDFFVVDVAETKEGDWIVIELNDAQMSGLSCNNPDILYGRIKEEMLS